VIRGNLVTVASQGDYGKPRPAVVIQSDLFDGHPSVTVLPLTTELRDTPLFRISVEPSAGNGLRQRSQIMIDKIHTVPRTRLGNTLGKLTDDQQVAVNRSLMLFLGLA